MNPVKNYFKAQTGIRNQHPKNRAPDKWRRSFEVLKQWLCIVPFRNKWCLNYSPPPSVKKGHGIEEGTCHPVILVSSGNKTAQFTVDLKQNGPIHSWFENFKVNRILPPSFPHKKRRHPSCSQKLIRKQQEMLWNSEPIWFKTFCK